MTPAFIAVVIDTLLPGDSGGPKGEPPLPTGSAAGIDLATVTRSHSPVLEAIAMQAGGADAFAADAEGARIAVIQSIEGAMPDAFRALLSALLADYYESAPALIAMGWRYDPPQPLGHEIAQDRGAMVQRLERMRHRGTLWRL